MFGKHFIKNNKHIDMCKELLLNVLSHSISATLCTFIDHKRILVALYRQTLTQTSNAQQGKYLELKARSQRNVE